MMEENFLSNDYSFNMCLKPVEQLDSTFMRNDNSFYEDDSSKNSRVKEFG